MPTSHCTEVSGKHVHFYVVSSWSLSPSSASTCPDKLNPVMLLGSFDTDHRVSPLQIQRHKFAAADCSLFTFCIDGRKTEMYSRDYDDLTIGLAISGWDTC